MSDTSSPLPAMLAPLTVPASWLYRGIITARNRRYDHGGVHQLDVPVISVGNITTGGVGKTPMVAWLAGMLIDAGHRPAICMRGYGATRHRLSDEQLELEAALPDVQIIANPDRVTAAASFLAEHRDVDCLLLDDGFQHRRLHRDVDLVLIDASRNTMNDRLLPAGHLREPPTVLARADAVIITHAEQEDAVLKRAVESCHGRPPLAWCNHVWSGLVHIDEHGETEQAVHWLRGRRVLTMLGVGNPQAIREQLAAAGAIIAADLPVRDHEKYGRAVLDRAHRAAAGLDATVVTAKDWAKLRDLLDLHNWPTPIIVPQLAIDFLAGRETLKSLVLSSIDTALPLRGH